MKIIVSSGGISADVSVTNGNTLQVNSGGSALDTDVQSGGNYVVLSGGTGDFATIGGLAVILGDQVGGTIANGGHVTISASGLATGDIVSSGGLQVIDAHGVASNTVVLSGGAEAMSGGGNTVGATISSGGLEFVGPGATATDITVSSGGYLVLTQLGTLVTPTELAGAHVVSTGVALIGSGGPFAGVAVVATSAFDNGDDLEVLWGGVTVGDTLGGGTSATEAIASGGADFAATLNNAGFETVSAGGVAIGPLVTGGGVAMAANGGIVIGATVEAGGIEIVQSGGLAIDTTNSGGLVVVLPGGAALNLAGGVTSTGVVLYQPQASPGSDTALNLGTLQTFGTISGSDAQYVLADGTATFTTVSSGGIQTALSGGLTTFTVVSNGGVEIVSAGGIANGTTVEAGGYLISLGNASVLSPVNDGGTVISGGVVLVQDDTGSDPSLAGVVSSAAAALNNASIGDGEVAYVLSGGSTSNAVLQGGGAEDVFASAAVTATTVSSGGSEILLGGTATLTTVLSGGQIELAAIAYSGGDAATVNTGDTLQVSQGGTVLYSQQLAGSYAGLSFVVTADNLDDAPNGSAGTMLTLQAAGDTVSSGTSVNNGTGTVLAGETSYGATVTSGAIGVVATDGVSLGANIKSGGESVISGGLGIGSVIRNGGNQQVVAGSTSGAIVQSGGTQAVFSGATTSFTLLPGGTEYVTSGAVASATQVQSDGELALLFGGFATSAIVSAGGELFLSAGASATSTTVLSGGFLALSAGNSILDTTVSSGGIVFLAPGNSATLTTVGSGGFLVVAPGAVASNTTALPGAEVISGGVAWLTGQSPGVNPDSGLPVQPTISAYLTSAANLTAGAGDSVLVLPGGTTSNLDLSNTGTAAATYLDVFSGGTASNTTLEGNTFNTVSFGGTDIGTTVQSGATENVLSGGVATNLTIDPGGLAVVYAGGIATGTTVDGGGTLIVLPGGVATGSTGAGRVVSSGATVDVISQGQSVAVSGTTNMGDIIGNAAEVQYVLAGATASDSQVGGSQIVASGGVANGSTLTSGGFEIVSSGGAASNTVVSSGGNLLALPGSVINATSVAGGTVINTGVAFFLDSFGIYDPAASTNHASVGAEETEYVLNGGTATATTVGTGGMLAMFSGGMAVGATLGFGASETVFNGGTASASTVTSAGIETVSSGGTEAGITISAGGVAVLGSGAVAAGGVAFAGASAALVIDASIPAATTIAGFAATDIIDLAALAYQASDSVTLLAGNTLQVAGAGGTTDLQLSPGQSFTGDIFALVPDTEYGGTDIVVTGNPAVTGRALSWTGGNGSWAAGTDWDDWNDLTTPLDPAASPPGSTDAALLAGGGYTATVPVGTTGTIGFVTIDGTSPTLSVAGTLDVTGGTGTIDVWVGASGTGSLIVAGAGATFGGPSSGAMGIGFGPGADGSVTVEDGGSLAVASTNSLYSGLGLGAFGTGDLVITGAGSSVSVAGGSYIGAQGDGVVTIGTGGLLSLTGSGALSLGSGVNISSPGSTVSVLGEGGSGLLTVGNGGTLSIANDANVGGYGASGTLALQTGAAAIIAGGLFVGLSGTTDGTIALGTGLVTIASDATADIGESSAGNSLLLGTYASTASAGGTGTVLVNGTVNFTGTPTTTGAGLGIGITGSGTMLVAGSAGAVAVVNGGTGTPLSIGAQSGGSGTLTIGAYGSVGVGTSNDSDEQGFGVGKVGNGLLVVSGTDAMLNAWGGSFVGRAGTGTLIVGNGGTLLAGDTTNGLSIGRGSTSNTSNLGGTGTGTIAAGGTLVSRNDLGVGGNGVTGFLEIDGYVQAATASWVGGGEVISGVIAAGSGTLQIDAGGTLSLDNASGVAGSGSAATGYDLLIGVDANANVAATGTVIVAGGGALLQTGTDGIAVGGGGTGASGVLSVGNGGEVVTDQATSNTAALAIGSAGAGSVAVTSGGIIDATGLVSVGDGGTLGGFGTLAVSGLGALLAATVFAVGGTGQGVASIGGGGLVTASGLVVVGGSGAAAQGALTIAAAGTLANTGSLTDVAQNPGATGTLVVSGTGALLQAGATLTIGDGGQGSATISTGGQVNVGNLLVVGNSATGNGTLSIGAGGTLSNNGLMANNGLTEIGGATGANGTITVSGAGAVLNSSSLGIAVGLLGSGLLSVGAGGTVLAGTTNSSLVSALEIGRQGTGTVLIAGSLAALDAVGNVVVGRAGSGVLDVTGHGSLAITADPYSNDALIIGAVGGRNGTAYAGGSGTVLVSGATLTAAGSFALGLGDSGTLSVQSGGWADAAGQVIVGGTALVGSGTTLVTASGVTGTSVLAANSLFAGSGLITVGAGGTLVAATNSQAMLIGDGAGTSGTISIAGSAALLQVLNGTLLVGDGGSALLSIGSLGLVQAGAVQVGAGDIVQISGGTLTTANVSLAVGAELIGYGTIDNGVSLGLLQSTSPVNNGTIDASGGTLRLAGTLSGTGRAQIETGATLELASGLLLNTNTLAFHGAAATLKLDASTAFTGSVTGLVAGDTIDLALASGASASIIGSYLVITPTGGSQITLESATSLSDLTVSHVSDGASGTDIVLTSKGLTISGTRAGQTTTDQASIDPLAGVTIGDTNAGQTETITLTVSSTADGTLSALGGGSYNATTGTFTITGSASQVTTALDGLVFTPTPHQVAPGQTVTTGFTLSVTDTDGYTTSDSTASVSAVAAAVSPTITGAVSGLTTSDTGTLHPFSTITIADGNAGQTETVTILMSAAANGTLSSVDGGSFSNGTYTVSGPASAVTTAVDALVFTPTPHQVAPGGTVTTGFTITDSDTAYASASNTVTSVIVTTGTAAPTITPGTPNQAISDNETLLPFAGIIVGDVNLGQTETLAVVMSPTTGGTLSNPGIGTISGGAYTVTGSASAVTAALDALEFTPVAHQVAPGSTVATGFTITDRDTVGLTASTTSGVIVTATTTAPTMSGASGNQAITDSQTLHPFATLAIAEVNFGQTETLTVVMSAAADGTLSNPGIGTISGGTCTVIGSAAAVTSAVEGLVFTPTAHQVAPGGTVATTFTIHDIDTSGATASTTSSLIVTAGTTAPTVTPGTTGQAISDSTTPQPFSGIVVGDVNFGQTETLTVVLSNAANGTLGNLDGGSVSNGTYSLSGSTSLVSAALDGLVFTPTDHQVAPGNTVATSFSIQVIDTAGLAAGTTAGVIVTAGTTAPTITPGNTNQAITDSQTLQPFSGIALGDVDFGQTEALTVVLSNAANGTLGNLDGGSFSNGTYSISGSASLVSAALDGLVFTPTAHQVAPGNTVATSFAIHDIDTAGATATITSGVIVTADATPPTISGSSTNQAISDSATLHPFSGVSIADSNSGQTETLTVVMSASADGTLSNPGIGTITGGTYTVSGSVAAVTSAIGELVFTPTAHQVAPGGTVTTSFAIGDIDTAGATASAASGVIVTAGTTSPTITAGNISQAISDSATLLPFAGMVVGDVDFGQAETLTVVLSNAANGTLSNAGIGTISGGTYTVTGSASAVTAALDALVFTPVAHQVAPGGTVATTFTVHDVDSAGLTASTTSGVVVTAGTAVPIISGGSTSQAIADNATLHPFATLAIAEVNFGQTETLTVVMSSSTDGTLSNPGIGTISGGTYTVIGSAGAVTSAVEGLIFTPTLHQVAPGGTVATTFTIHDVDTSGATAGTTSSLIVTAGTTAPTVTPGTTGQAISDSTTPQPFSGIVVGDVNFGQTETLTVVVSNAANGTLGNLDGGSVSNGTYSLSGSTSLVSAALDGLVFTPTDHQVAPGNTVATSFSIQVIDTAGLAAGTTSEVIVVAGTATPTITAGNSSQAITDSGTLLPFAGIAVGDANAGQTETLTVVLSAAADGTLANLDGGSFSNGTYSISGSASLVTSALDGLVFTPTAHQVAPGNTVATSFAIHDIDTSGATAATTSGVIVTDGITSPAISLPIASQTITDTSLLSLFGGLGITDPNAGQSETVTVVVSNPADGTLGNLGGGTFGNGTYSISGSASLVSAALDGLVFTPTAHQVAPGGTVATSFAIRDVDTSGASAGTSTSLIVTAGTTAPTMSGAVSGRAISDSATLDAFSGVTISDANFGQTETLTVVMSAAADGTLSNPGIGTISGGTYTVIGSAAAVTSAVEGLVFTPTAHQVTPGQTVTTGFTISDRDTAGVSATPNTTTSVIVTASTAAPTISAVVASQAIADNSTLQPLSNVTIADANFGQTETLTVLMSTTADGTLSNPGIGTISGGTYTVTGSASAVTAALDALVFTPTQHQVAPGQTVTTGFAITDRDTAGAESGSITSNVTVTASALAPTISNTTTHSTTQGAAVAAFANAVIADANAGQTETLRVVMSAASGVFSDPGGGSINGGTYTVSGSAAAVTAAIEGLLFTAATALSTTTTDFTITDSDTAGTGATDSNTSVTATSTTTLIENAGNVWLLRQGNTYQLATGNLTGPTLSFQNSPVLVGQFGADVVLVAAEQVSGGYAVMWNLGNDQFAVWDTDSAGNYTATATAVLAGNSFALEQLETQFNVDLNGDGSIGPVGTQVGPGIWRVGNTYLLGASLAAGVLLQLQGSAVTVGQFGSAVVPLAAIAVTGGFEVMWSLGNDQFVVWNTDAGGNDTGNATAVLAGDSEALEALEPQFSDDLNGDGSIGLVGIQLGPDLWQVGSNYLLGTSDMSGVVLQLQSSAVTPGQFGSAVKPLAAEQLPGGGYAVVWNLGSSQFVAWSTDSTGNYTANATPVLAGTSYALELLEGQVGIDLNGDDTIGPSGTALGPNIWRVGSNYVIGASLASAVLLQLQGSPVTVGQFGGSVVPLAATPLPSGGWEVPWSLGNSSYTVWDVSAAGNYTGNPTGVFSGAGETQAVDASIGVSLTGGPTPTATNLGPDIWQVGSGLQTGNEFLIGTSVVGSVLLQFQGSPVTSGEFGAGIVPIAAAPLASGGWEVAWWLNGDETVWDVDANGNYVSSPFGAVAPTNAQLEALEPGFNDDLSENGTIGLSGSRVLGDLWAIGSNFALGTSLASAVLLQLQDSAVTSGQFGGSVAPLIATQLASGDWEVGWTLGNGQFTVWEVGANGNYLGNPAGVVTGGSLLAAIELSLGSALPSGPAPSAAIATQLGQDLWEVGSTLQAGNDFLIGPSLTGGMVLQLQGSAVTSGQFGSGVKPLAAQQLASGDWEIAWSLGNGQFTVWELDATGDYVGNAVAVITAGGLLTALELSLGVGLPSGPAPSASAATQFGRNVWQVGNDILLGTTLAGSMLLQFQGSPVTAGQFGGGVTPIAAAPLASGGWQVAWSLGNGQDAVWDVDDTGNYVSSSGAVSPQSFAVQDMLSANLVTTAAAGGAVNLGAATGPTTVDLGSNTALAALTLGSAPTLSFLGTPDAISLGTPAATIEYTLAPGSGVETVTGFTWGVDEMNLDLQGGGAGALAAYDVTIGGQHAVFVTSSTDQGFGVVLLNPPSTAAALLTQHTSISEGHALIT